MEHVTITPEGGTQVRLTADKGYQLRSKKSGNQYDAISTHTTKNFEVIKTIEEEIQNAPKQRVRKTVNPARE